METWTQQADMPFLLTPLREGRQATGACTSETAYFYSRPCGRGDLGLDKDTVDKILISTHAPAGGATEARRGTLHRSLHFYSRPCGRGDDGTDATKVVPRRISTHAPAGGATGSSGSTSASGAVFLLTPLREGRLCVLAERDGIISYFYSRPCGRGDQRRGVQTA